MKIPKMWRKAKMVALLKPGTDHKSPKYRLISLLCPELFKILERLVLNRISATVDALLDDQAGFCSGKSCDG